MLVLGGWDDRYNDLFDVVKKRAMQADLKLRFAALSIPDELRETDLSSIDGRMRNRGRFLALLVEGLFEHLPDKSYCLIVIHAGVIYDMNDFEQDLASKFISSLFIDLEETTVINNEGLRNSRLNELLQFTTGIVEISFSNDNMPIEWDDRLRLSFDSVRRQFSLMYKTDEKQDKLDFQVRTRSVRADAKIEVYLDGKASSGVLKAERDFIKPAWRGFCEDSNEGQILLEHIAQLKKTDQPPYCPLCQREHRFSRPFYCNETQGDLLEGISSEGSMIIDSLKGLNARYVLIKKQEMRLGFIASARDILEFDDMTFIYVDIEEKSIFKVRYRQGTMELEKADRIVGTCDKLYQFGGDELVYLTK